MDTPTFGACINKRCKITKDHGTESISVEISNSLVTPALKRRIAAPRENFLANKKQGTDVELFLHHSDLNSFSWYIWLISCRMKRREKMENRFSFIENIRWITWNLFNNTNQKEVSYEFLFFFLVGEVNKLGIKLVANIRSGPYCTLYRFKSCSQRRKD